MTDLIDREALREALWTLHRHMTEDGCHERALGVERSIRDILDAQPTPTCAGCKFFECDECRHPRILVHFPHIDFCCNRHEPRED